MANHRRHQNFDYTTIAERLSTVSWSNYCHPTGVVKPITGSQPARSPQQLENIKALLIYPYEICNTLP